MANPLMLVALVARLSDEVLVRGSVEMNREDGGTRPFQEPIPLAGGFWGPPIVSGNPSVPLALWVIWGGRVLEGDMTSLVDKATRDRARELVALGKVKFYVWKPETENLTEFKARWKADVNWINGTEAPRAAPSAAKVSEKVARAAKKGALEAPKVKAAAKRGFRAR